MTSDPLLDSFWYSFPQDPHLPMGLGVTAYSEPDARALLREQGFGACLAEAKEVSVQQGVSIGNLNQGHVVPNMGPMQLRGVWYPCMNIGFGAAP
jgi:hypothetical protein